MCAPSAILSPFQLLDRDPIAVPSVRIFGAVLNVRNAVTDVDHTAFPVAEDRDPISDPDLAHRSTPSRRSLVKTTLRHGPPRPHSGCPEASATVGEENRVGGLRANSARRRVRPTYPRAPMTR